MPVPARLPAPPDAPPPGSCVRIERPEPGLALVVLDPPHRSLAVLDGPLLGDLERALDALAAERGLTGVVLTGRAPTSFAAGADVDALAAIEEAALAEELARFGQALFQRIADLAPRTVAAVGGPVPGGAYELALACDAIVLADHPSTRIGLPETRLGILPGWGGSQRLPRRIGVPRALAAILSGKLHVPYQAKRLVLVDRLTHPEYLLRVASDIAMGREPLRRRERGVWRWLVDVNPLALALIASRARAALQKETRGKYPAPERALELVVAAPRTALATGFDREAIALGELAVSSECKSLVGLFQVSEEAKRLAKLPDGSPARALERAAVIGGGVMGGSIAGLLAERGLATRLADLARAPLDAALVQHAARVEKDLAKHRYQPHEARAAVDRLTVTTDAATLGRAEIAIEAVAEKLEVKRAVLMRLAATLSSHAIVATNTSSLSVDQIAAGLPHPERVVGMHFFNPVHRMPLVEVVRGARTSDAVVAAVAKLALQLGKTPVVVRDVAGFLVNRLLGPYLDEAVRVLEQGVEPATLEAVALDFGMPMGPLELLDEVGFDIAAHAAASLHAAYGERMHASDMLARMLQVGLSGKKGGAGFYLYAPDPRTGRPVKTGLNPALADLIAVRHGPPMDTSPAAIQDQLVLSMVNEAALCLEEGVVAGPRELDLATVFGMGFPPFRGGLLRYADRRGLGQVVDALRRIDAAPDVRARPHASERFRPAPRLAALAAAGGTFHPGSRRAP
jgi:3-hydroxyacyl-CoA dehydrogenase/enoyl-CoA hydratase/3-hydroxybutyryl-CoA epimerase